MRSLPFAAALAAQVLVSFPVDAGGLAIPVRVELRTGAVLTGLLDALEGGTLALHGPAGPAVWELASVSAVVFAPDAAAPDWTGEPVLALTDGSRHSFRAVEIRHGRLDARTTGGSVRDFALNRVRALRLAPSSGQSQPSASLARAALERLSVRLARAGDEVGALRRRLDSTAHRDDPAEHAARMALSDLERAALALAAELAPGDPGAAFGPATVFAARAQAADAALGTLLAYDSLRQAWSALREALLDETLRDARLIAEPR